MNVLDENILESQRQLLRSWKIPVRQIGVDLGRKGMADEQILPFLLTLSKPTFFTRDLGFANAEFCHDRRSLVVLAVGQYEQLISSVRPSGTLLSIPKPNEWAR